MECIECGEKMIMECDDWGDVRYTCPNCGRSELA